MSSSLKILFLTFYYSPDLCAGSFRSAALVKALQSLLPLGSHIEIITTIPNRYSSFSTDALEFENEENISIRRIKLPSHKSGMKDQSKAFFSYAKAVCKETRDPNKKYDLVFATSSRLMTAVLGAYIARSQKIPLYLDIRDIFVDTINDVFSKKYSFLAASSFSVLERYAINYASKVNLVSEGFEEYFRSRYENINLSFYTNGIDDDFVADIGSEEIASHRPYEVIYAGNIGEGQGLHLILPYIAKKMEGKVKFIIIGDGGRRGKLEEALKNADVKNVLLRSPVNRGELVELYKKADVLFLHLNDYDAFRKVLPSKIFEYASLGKPIWAGVAGYAEKFIKEEVENAVVFPPCNAHLAVQSFDKLKMENIARDEFVRKYLRSNIMQRLAADIISTARRH